MADQGAEGILSPYLRRKRFEAVLPHLRGTILDYGCGSGKLAAFVNRVNYCGIDIDNVSLRQAAIEFPYHDFISKLPDPNKKFSTIVSLAVIEHVDSPEQFLCELKEYLEISDTSRLVITTPHPSVGWVHDLGSTIGLFSRHANEEHEELLGRSALELAGEQADLKLITYRRFLFGANQLAVFGKR